MKSLSLQKPLMIVVVGLPGSGKSFFARQFSETFSAPAVMYNRIRHIVYGEGGFEKNEQLVVEVLAQHEIDELLKTHKTFIVDSHGSTASMRANLRKKAQTAGYDVLLVWVQTDEATAKYRSMKRSNRRKDDIYNPSISSVQYEVHAKRFSAPTTRETHVVISGKHTYATQAKVVLKKLVAPRETKVSIINHGDRAPNAHEPRRNVIIR